MIVQLIVETDTAHNTFSGDATSGAAELKGSNHGKAPSRFNARVVALTVVERLSSTVKDSVEPEYCFHEGLSTQECSNFNRFGAAICRSGQRNGRSREVYDFLPRLARRGYGNE
jgi:hypothetical protein